MRGVIRCATVLAMMAAAPMSRAATLVVCTEASPSTLNPQLSTAGTVFDVAAQFYDELVETERGGSTIVPGLAESWTVAPDGLSVTFKLRHGVKFHTNRSFTPTRPMNADDVIFSFHRMRDNDHPYHVVNGQNYDEWDALLRDRVADVVKVDDDTVRFDLKEKVAPLLGILTMQAFPILSAEYGQAMLKAGTPQRLDAEPIGTGPFSFVSYQKDATLRMRANPEFWGKAANLPDRAAQVDSLVFSITQEPAVRLAKLRANECQVARYPNPADLPAIRADKDLSLIDAPVASEGYIAFRADKPPFDKREVRQAMAEAIDLDALVKAVFQGTGTPTGAMIPASLWGHNDRVEPHPYDPAHAKQLLATAGYPDGFKTQLWAIPVVRAYMPDGRRAAEMIQADWAKIGVQAEIVTYEWGEYLRRVRGGDAPVGMLGGTWDYPDPSQLVYGYWACPDGKPRPGNWSRWCNPRFTDLVSQANALYDRGQRAKLYVEAQDVFAADTPAILFASTSAYVAARKSVTGLKMHVLGGFPFGGVGLTP